MQCQLLRHLLLEQNSSIGHEQETVCRPSCMILIVLLLTQVMTTTSDKVKQHTKRHLTSFNTIQHSTLRDARTRNAKLCARIQLVRLVATQASQQESQIRGAQESKTQTEWWLCGERGFTCTRGCELALLINDAVVEVVGYWQRDASGAIGTVADDERMAAIAVDVIIDRPMGNCATSRVTIIFVRMIQTCFLLLPVKSTCDMNFG